MAGALKAVHSRKQKGGAKSVGGVRKAIDLRTQFAPHRFDRISASAPVTPVARHGTPPPERPVATAQVFQYLDIFIILDARTKLFEANRRNNAARQTHG